jgi:hypothetical protein
VAGSYGHRNEHSDSMKSWQLLDYVSNYQLFKKDPAEGELHRSPSSGVTGMKRESNHSTPSGDEVKNVWFCISTPLYAFVVWFLRTEANLPLLLQCFIC